MTTSTSRRRADNNLKSKRRTSPRRPQSAPVERPQPHYDPRPNRFRAAAIKRRAAVRPRHRARRNHPSRQTGPTNRIRTKTGGDIEACRCFRKTPRRRIAAAFLLLQPFRRWQNARVGITRRQFEQMRERLGGVSPRMAAPVFESTLRCSGQFPSRDSRP